MSTAVPAKPRPANPFVNVLKALASLKFTVILFSLSMVLVFVGTLAQVEQDMWEVLDKYFKSWIVMVDVKVLFPPSFFPNIVRSDAFQTIETLRFPFTGGALLGVCLSVNLLAAHLVRFKVQAKGERLLIGYLLLAAGAAIAAGVILSGNFKDGLQTEPFVSYGTLWVCYQVMLVALWAAMLYRFVVLPSERWLEQRLLLVGTLLLTVGIAWLFYSNARLADEYMRILWQLTQGLGAGVVMLLGAIMVFRRRAGIVVLHAGVGIMMAGVMIASLYSIEERVTLFEGDTTNYTFDIRNAELAVVDTSDEKQDSVVAVPFSLVKQSKANDETVQADSLPFDIKLEQAFPNAILKPARSPEEKLATAGAGTEWTAVPQRKSSGADADGEVDLPAAYVTFLDKSSKEPIDTHLLSIIQSSEDEPEKVTVGDKTYDVYLRFKRTYRPFSLTLIDVRKDDYVGTSTPKNYSSDVRLVDPSRGEDRKVHIWMNNPLRYANLTFYQSGYSEVNGKERTDLQVVRNLGWMIPYVACSVVGVGMFWHFGLTLMRFLGGLPRVTTGGLWTSRLGTAAVVLLVVVTSMLSGRRLMNKDGFDMAAASRIPVVHEGRVKPLGTLARTTMRAMANRSTFKTSEGEKLPAIRWIFDLCAADPAFHDGVAPETPAFKTHPVFRIDNLEVLDTLGLERRSRFRYALDEFEDMLTPAQADGEPTEFAVAIAEARKLEPEELNTYQRKLLETEKRLTAYKSMEVAFSASTVPLPPPGQFNSPAGRQMLNDTFGSIDMLKRFSPPLAVPTNFDELEMERWQPYATARAISEIQLALNRDPDPATIAWNNIIQAYAKGDPEEFNKNVESYLAGLKSKPPPEFNDGQVKVESIMNMYAPFTMCMVLYVGSFVVQCFGWLFSNNPKIRSASTTILVGCLIVHTIALVARLYVSGRPAPVTNLYSSAIFIGWSVAFAGIFLEVISRLGVGNILASMSGFISLLIAAGLANKGDTFTVMQAVLDTDFWLTTHVVCITLGYATTFGAGLLGAIYIVLGTLTTMLSKSAGQTLNRMTYGMLCFAIFFSFIGTVLGGLWADDSWGRFWGWDPKENGALLIVLWNAIVLHARWGGMIRHRGVAVLSVVGNIVTAWSWFGTNELGVGLHSYGFTDGVLLRLFMFVLSQWAVIALGLLPLRFWRSNANMSAAIVDEPSAS